MARATTAKFAEFVFEVEWIASSGIYTRICGVTDVQFTRAANVDSTEVPDCDDESKPYEVEKEVRSLELTVSGSGVWARQSHEAILDWFYSGRSKLARIGHLNAGSGDTVYEGGPCLLTSVANQRTKGQRVTAALEFAFSGLDVSGSGGSILDPWIGGPASDLSLRFDTPLDESGSPLTYTLTNNARRITATKKFGTASLLTDPVAESAVQLASNIDFGSDDFTIEGWLALNGEPATKQIAGRWGSSGNRAWNLSYEAASNQFRFACSSDGAATAGTASFDLDTDGVGVAGFFDGNFHHVAIVRDGTEITVYVDGIAGAGAFAIGSAIIYNGGTNYTFIGGSAVPATQAVASTWPGYLDEWRISTRARYTAAFTPPSAAFGRNGTDDPHFSSVAALFGFDGLFGITQSGVVTNPVVLVNYGSADIGPFDAHGIRGKAGFIYPYIESDGHFGFGSGDFTIELLGVVNVGGGWGNTLRQIAGPWSTTAGQRAWRIILSTSTTFQFEYSLDGSTTAATVDFTGVIVEADTAYDLAVVRQGSSLRLYCNGALVATTAISGALFNPNSILLPLGILSGITVALNSSNQADTSSRIKGLRTLKGWARFRALPVPDFAPVPNALVAVGSFQKDEAIFKYGSASFRSLGGWIEVPDTSPGLHFTNEDFTFETWIRSDNLVTPDFCGLFSQWGGAGNRSQRLQYNATTNSFVWEGSSDGTASSWTAAFDVDTDSALNEADFWAAGWHHVAVNRRAGVVTVYVDGVAGSTTASIGSGTLYETPSHALVIGARHGTTTTPVNAFPGNLDEVRVSIGRARYTGAFTPRSKAFPHSIQGDPYIATVKLLCDFE